MTGAVPCHEPEANEARSQPTPHRSNQSDNAAPCGYAALGWSASTWRLQIGFNNLAGITSIPATQLLSKRPLSGPIPPDAPNLAIALLNKVLLSKGYRIIIIFDNLDRYYFQYTRYSFFPQYRSFRDKEVHNNIGVLISRFTHGGSLSKLGACALFVLRPEVLDLLNTIEPVQTRTEGLHATYVLKPVHAKHVLEAREKLFNQAWGVARPEILKKQEGGVLEEFYELRLHELASTPFKLDVSDNFIGLIHDLNHSSHRTMVEFLRLINRVNSEDFFNRVNEGNDIIVLLLFLLRFRRRYSQQLRNKVSNSVASTTLTPNMFLNDCLVSYNSNYPDAHLRVGFKSHAARANLRTRSMTEAA